MTTEQPAQIARRLIRSNMYLTLGSADGAGTPWVSPVFYVADAHSHFLWVSPPDARHSRNVAERPEVSIVIFDSKVPLGHAQAVYISARAKEVAAGDLEAAVQAFSRGSVGWGGGLDSGACPGAGG